MDEMISFTHQYLLKHYGPLLTLKHIAEVMHTTPNGIRMAISRQRQPFSASLARAQRRLGRRVYFEARRVAQIIDQDPEDTQATPQPLQVPESHSNVASQDLPRTSCPSLELEV